MNRFVFAQVASAGQGNRGRAFLCGIALSALGTGCMKPIQYTPNEGLVPSLGTDQAKQELQILMARSVEPLIGLVEAKDDSVHYRWNQQSMGAFYQTITTSVDTEIFYANLNRIEIYENHNVFVWGPNDSRVDKIRFASAEEAKRFADLLMSFRARWLASRGSPAPPTAQPAAPAPSTAPAPQPSQP
jgi:hypothetical protein